MVPAQAFYDDPPCICTSRFVPICQDALPVMHLIVPWETVDGLPHVLGRVFCEYAPLGSTVVKSLPRFSVRPACDSKAIVMGNQGPLASCLKATDLSV